MPFSKLMLRAVCDFTTEIKHGINIQSGDIMTLIDPSDNWWFVRKDWKYGYVPKNLVEVINLKVKLKIDSNLYNSDVMHVCIFF